MDKPVITQDMIRLYDEYTHLTLDRRGFMDRLTTLTGSAAAAAAIAPMIAANSARAALSDANDPRLETAHLTYPGASGPVKAYLARPKDRTAERGSVIVIHENRGLNGHIEDVARRVALQGFIALAPDFLSPAGGTPADEDKARELFPTLDRAVTVRNASAAVAFLRGQPGSNRKVGAVGFCWGGGLVNALAVAEPNLNAGVAYYGAQPDPASVPAIKAKLLLHYAGLDERINAGIPAYEAALKGANIEHTIHIYEGAQHAFNNDTSDARYNKAAAELAFSRTIAFFNATLA